MTDDAGQPTVEQIAWEAVCEPHCHRIRCDGPIEGEDSCARAQDIVRRVIAATGQPTVDRLGALEAALRLMLTHGERCNWFADRGDEEVCDQARAALDAASPLTTPTPDKGALELAREIVKRATFGYGGSMDDEPNHDAIDPGRIKELIAAALTAAESETRAAAIACCSPKADEAWTREAARTGELIAERIGALATPAQPPSTVEVEWLRRLLRWCRPRLTIGEYKLQLDKYLAAGPSVLIDEPAIVHSTPAQSAGK